MSAITGEPYNRWFVCVHHWEQISSDEDWLRILEWCPKCGALKVTAEPDVSGTIRWPQRLEEHAEAQVVGLCEDIGYGRVMQVASEAWREKDPIGALQVGGCYGAKEESMAKSDRGFASMDPEKQKKIASKGGKAAHHKGTAHEWTKEEAREAGRAGGSAGSAKRQARRA